MSHARRAILLTGCLAFAWGTPARAQGAQGAPASPPRGSLLARRYHDGETLRYHMRATHQSRDGVVRYEGDATGRVARDSLGHFVETLEWSHLVRNDSAVALPAGSASVRQRLTLAPDYMLPPDVAHTDPRLVGPVLDLFTFYVDAWLAAKFPTLAHAGDHVRVPGHGANSWADGHFVLVGDDAIDFVITLQGVDTAAQVARVLVQHVPPESGRVTLPAEWMQPRIGAEPNNWVEISAAPGGFAAAVGRETFDVLLTVRLTDGMILAATMDNPVEVIERTCTDRALTQCGAPVRSQIRRTISLDLVPGP